MFFQENIMEKLNHEYSNNQIGEKSVGKIMY